MGALQGQNILIVEPRVDGAQARRAFTLIVASIDQAAIKDHLTLPTLLYGTADAERYPDAILARLTRRLSS